MQHVMQAMQVFVFKKKKEQVNPRILKKDSVCTKGI